MMEKGFLGKLLTRCLLLAIFAGASGPLIAAEVRDIRIAATDTGTRVVLDLSAPVKHKAFLLDDPGRVVLDVARSSLKTQTARRRRPHHRGALGQAAEQRAAAGVRDQGSGHDRRPRRWRPSAGAGNRLVLDITVPGCAPRTVAVTPAAPVAIRPAHAPAESGRDIVVAVDAGHGGVDPGASGRRGTREKDVVLEVARALAARINQEPGMKAVLTRDGDYFISLQERTARARRAKADLFVSIHADAIANPGRVRFFGVRALRARRLERGGALAGRT